MNHDHLFVYGLLMRNHRGGPMELLEKHAKYMCTAQLKGRLYLVDDYPGAVVSNNTADIVHGEVYRVDEPHLLFPRLDEFEECGPNFPSPTEYVRKKEQVFLINGRSIYAWVYLYNREVESLPCISSGRFTCGVER